MLQVMRCSDDGGGRKKREGAEQTRGFPKRARRKVSHCVRTRAQIHSFVRLASLTTGQGISRSKSDGDSSRSPSAWKVT